MKSKLSTYTVYRDMSYPIWTEMARNDVVFCDKNFAKFSKVKIDDNWYLFSELIATKYPGYILD